MNRMFFFLLLALVATTTLAAPSGRSPTVLEDDPPTVNTEGTLILNDDSPTALNENFPTVLIVDSSPDLFALLTEYHLSDIYSLLDERSKIQMKGLGKGYKKLFESVDHRLEWKILKRFRDINQELQMDDEVVSILVQDHAIKEVDARKAVEVATKAWIRKDYRSYVASLHKQLNLIPQRTTFLNMEKICKKAWNNVRDQREQSKRCKPYNVSKDLDAFFASILTEIEGKRKYGPQFEVDAAKVTLALRRAHTKIASEIKDQPALNSESYFEERMLVELEPKVHIAYKVWCALQRARQNIKEKGSKHRNGDDQLVQELVPLLAHIADEGEIRKIMGQARKAHVLGLAVILDTRLALRDLVSSNIYYPGSVFRLVVQIAVRMGYLETLEILRQHPASELIPSSSWLKDDDADDDDEHDQDEEEDEEDEDEGEDEDEVDEVEDEEGEDEDEEDEYEEDEEEDESEEDEDEEDS